MTTRFRGVKYRVKVKRIRRKLRAYGLAMSPTSKRPRLIFDPTCFGKKFRRKFPNGVLEVLVHEALHACFWDLDEDAVKQSGKDIARFLKKMGVRI